MLRSLFLALFVGVALARPDTFTPRLVYRYEAQLVTGAPEGSKLWSGLHLSANLTLDFLEKKNTMIVSLEDVSFQKMDKFIEERTPSFFMQMDDTLMDGVEANVLDDMIRSLEYSFSFRWTHGHVSDIRLKKKDPEWSANIKRGIMSMFEVNLGYTYSTNPIPDRGVFVHPVRLPSYTVWENSLFGYCRTTYTSSLPLNPTTNDRIYLTKVRDLPSCLMKSPMSYVFNNVLSEKEDNSTDHLDLQAEVTYAIKYSKENFQIETAIGESKVLFVPWAHQDGGVQTTINQTMYLIEKYSKNTGSIKMGGKKSSLQMVLASHDVEGRQPYVFHEMTQKPPISWSKHKLDQLLTFVANGSMNMPSKEVLFITQTLVELMRQSDKDILKSLLHDLKGNVTDDLMKATKFNVYWNLLSTGGTTAMADVLLRHCRDEAPLWRHKDCISAITSVGMYSPPSENIIMLLNDILNAAFKLRSDKKSAETMMVSALALGSVIGRGEDMVNDMNKKAQQFIKSTDIVLRQHSANLRLDELKQTQKDLMNKMDAINAKHHDIADKFQKQLMTMFLKSGQDFDYILAFKALRNAHVHLSIPLLKHMLTNSGLDPAIRVAAAQAFEKFINQGEKHKQEVLDALEQVMKDPKADVAIRIQAFRSLLNVHAPVQTLIRLAGSLRYENQRQLSTYVFSVFHNIRNMTTFKPYLESADKFQAAVAYLPPLKDQGYDDSAYRMYHHPLAKDASLLHELNFIRSPKYVMSADISNYISLFGTTNKAFQVSWLSDGLVKLMKKMYGPDGLFTNRKSLYDLIHRKKRNIDIEEPIDDIFEKLNITTRTIPELKSYVSIQMMNNVIRSYELTELLQGLLSKCSSPASCKGEGTDSYVLPIDYKSGGMMGEFFMELPTAAGFPMTLQMGLIYSANIFGKAWATMQKEKVEIARKERTSTTIQAGLDLHPQLTTSFMGKMSVDGYLFQTGSVFHGSLDYKAPINLTAIIIPDRNTYELNFMPPVQAKKPILQLDLTPYVYSRSMPTMPRRQPNGELRKRPLFLTMQPLLGGHDAKSQQFSWELNPNLLGYKAKLEGQYPWRPLKSAVAFPMLGKVHYSLYIQPGDMESTYVNAGFRLIHQKCPRPSPINDAPPQELPDNLDLMSDDITHESIKHKMQEHMKRPLGTHECGKEWSFVAKLRGCDKNLPGQCNYQRSAILMGIVPRWGQEITNYYNSSFLFVRSPLPNYDPNPWEMFLQTSALFPTQTLTVENLMEPTYQASVHDELMRLMRTQGQDVVNKQFQNQVMTQTLKDALRRQPSLEPKLMLDRIMPEIVMQYDQHLLRPILNRLTPLSEEALELKTEMKNAFKITGREDLIKELADQTIDEQKLVLKLLEARNKIKLPPRSGIEYVVLKLSQVVFDMRETLDRAAQLCLVSNCPGFAVLKNEMGAWQKMIYHKCPRHPLPQPLNLIEHDSVNVPFEVRELILNLKKLTNQQMDDIYASWLSRVEQQRIERLANTTARNVTLVSQYIESTGFEKNETIRELLLQASVQHQILVEMLSAVRVQNSTASPDIVNIHRYAIKVQTKELTERAYVLRSQHKQDGTCGVLLASKVTKTLQKDLQKNDRRLVALQQDHIIVPSQSYPWTSDVKNLRHGALKTMQDVLRECQRIKEAIIKLPLAPHPCLTRMLVDTAITLQQKVDIFKRTLTAQPYDEELTLQYQALEDQVMSLQLSLGPVFEKYLNMKSIFVPGLISPMEAKQDLNAIERGQDVVKSMLDKYADVRDPTFDVTSNVFEEANKKCQELKDLLKSAESRVKNAIQGTTADKAKELKEEYIKVLNKQIEILTVMRQIARSSSEFDKVTKGQIRRDQRLIEEILERVTMFPLPPVIPGDISDDTDDEVEKSDEEMTDKSCIDDFMLSSRYKVKFAAHVGYTGDNSMCLQISSRKSVQQLLWETAQFYPHSRDGCVTQAVKETVSARDRLHKCSMEVRRRLNSFFNVHLLYDSGYEELPSWIDYLALKMDQMYFPRTAMAPAQPFISQGTIQAVLDFSPVVDSVDMYYMSEKKTMDTQSIPLCRHFKPLYPFQSVTTMKDYAMMAYTHARLPASCKIEQDNLRTFDSSVYHIPRFHTKAFNFDLTPVPHPLPRVSALLSMDCSADKKFAVIMEEGQDSIYKLIVFTESHNVTIESLSNIEVDKTAKIISSDRPYNTSKLLEGMDVIDMSISRQEDGSIRLYYPLVGLSIVIDGNNIRLDVSYVYKGQVCGLCGNYDGETNSELQGPQMEAYTAATDFWKSYLMYGDFIHV